MKQVNLGIPQRVLMLLFGLLLSVGAMAQITVNGHVKDATGEDIIGATVRLVGEQGGTVTDFEGNFSLKCKKGAQLQISYVGYTTQTVQAAETLEIVLQSDEALLNEVVVIGYGVAKKNDLTGSVTAIKPDDKNHALVTNAQDMIQGKIAGVNVTSDGGTPGAGSTIKIRGGSSLNASNKPLIVIDGLAMDNEGVQGMSNPLSMVNPNDIESFTVLKDASATAIYGSRGSNGVIIITTKKGRKNQAPTITYNGNVSYSAKKKTIDVMSGDQFREYVQTNFADDADAIAALGDANTDWQSEIYRGAISTDHNITIAGGFAGMPYRVSLGYTDQNGILKTSNFQRTTASVSLNPTFLQDHLTVNFNAKYMYAYNRYADTGAVSAAVYMDPTQPVTSSDAKYDNFDGYFQWTQTGKALNDDSWPYTRNGQATQNPVALLEQKDNHANSNALIGNLELDYKIHGFEDLRLHMNFGMDLSSGKQPTYVTPYSGASTYYGTDSWEQIDKYNLSYSAYAQYYKDITKEHHFDIMAGYEWQHFHREHKSEWYTYYLPTNNDKAKAGQIYQQGTNPWKTENYLVSFYGRANYSFLDRYLLTATFRYDGSSRFKEHWALFPSFAFGWKIKEESFLKDVDALSDLKLRLGWGKTGQQDGIGDYNYFASYTINTSADSYYPIYGDGHTKTPAAYNNDLKWETTTTTNVGIDYGFFDGRLTGSVDYYYRKTTDLLNYAYVRVGNFRNQINQNIGSLENQGVELSLTGRPIQTNDWQWEVGFNATYNKNKITELVASQGDDYYVATGGISAGTGNNCQAHKVGYPASSFYVYQQVYDANGQPLEGVYVDRNGDGQINESDKYIYKSPAAPWTFGFTSKLTYKEWDFGFSLRASLGNYVFNDLEAGASNTSTIWSYNYLSNRPTNCLAKAWSTWDNVLSDYFVQNASFLKCDNITLGYSFSELFKGANYHGLTGRVYATCSNVFTITKYKGIDPEVSGGIDNNLYPRPITFTVGVSVNF